MNVHVEPPADDEPPAPSSGVCSAGEAIEDLRCGRSSVAPSSPAEHTPDEGDEPPVPSFTWHAKCRVGEMGLTQDEVAAAFLAPHYAEGPGALAHPDRTRRVRYSSDGRLAIVWAPGSQGPTIITVMWRWEFTRSEAPRVP